MKVIKKKKIMNKIMNKIITLKMYLIFIIIIFINGCNNRKDKNIDMQNKILCIEDIYNKEGLYGGNFGDIVVYDADTFERFILTNDKYFDYSPTYSKKYNIIMFESLRNYQTYTGLTSQRDLLILDLSTNKIKKFDTEERFKEVNILHSEPSLSGDKKTNTDNFGPLFNHIGDKFLFYKRWGNLTKTVILYNFIDESFKIIVDSLRNQANYIWSQNDSLVYYTKDKVRSIRITKPNEIYNYNVYNKKVKSVMKDANKYFNVYDERDKKLLCVTKLLNKNVYRIEILDLITKEEIFSISTEELGVDEIYSPIFKDSNNIIFVGQINKDNYNQYLYKIKLDTKEIKKLSNNGGHKDCLSYIR